MSSSIMAAMQVVAGNTVDNRKSLITGTKSLGQDDFLKLLVAEMQNQNPMEQTDSKQFIAEMAQFSSVEQMKNVQTELAKLTTLIEFMNFNNLIAQGSSLIDKQISAIDPQTGETVNGIVKSVRVDNGQVMLEPMEVPLENVTEITKGGI